MKLIDSKQDKKVLKSITFKLDEELVDRFRSLTKELKLKQGSIIENAIEKAIEEMEELKNEKQ